MHIIFRRLLSLIAVIMVVACSPSPGEPGSTQPAPVIASSRHSWPLDARSFAPRRSDSESAALPTASEACTPALFALSGRTSLSGSTLGHSDDFASFCGDTTPAADLPDVVYGFSLAARGSFLASVTSNTPGFNPAVYLRTDCSTDYACFDFAPASRPEQIGMDLPAGDYFLVVDGAPGAVTSGAFTLRASFALPACGDGVVNAGEQCDVGHQIGAGCGIPGSAAPCQFDPPGAGDSCAGAIPVSIAPGTAILSGTTYGYTNDFNAPPHTIPPGGPDRVYQVTPSASGTLTVSLGFDADGTTPTCNHGLTTPGCWDRVLYAESACGDSSSLLGFADIGAIDVEEISFPVVAGTPYSIIVDGYDDQYYSTGPFNLLFRLQ